MNWEFSFTTSRDDHNLLISVKFFVPCHKQIWLCIQYVTLCSQMNSHEMHMDSHTEILLENFQVASHRKGWLWRTLLCIPASTMDLTGHLILWTEILLHNHRHISKVTFLSTVSHRLCDVLYFFLKLKSRSMNLYGFNLFIQGFMEQFESKMLKILLLLFLKLNL